MVMLDNGLLQLALILLQLALQDCRIDWVKLFIPCKYGMLVVVDGG